jgi:hypothetical protein
MLEREAMTMSIGFIFWLMMILWFLLAMVGRWAPQQVPWSPIVNDVFLFILFFLLGWHSFGFVIKA